MEKNNDNQARVANPELDDVLNIPFNEININREKILGEGGFSVIYLGVWNGKRLAVKRLKFFLSNVVLLQEARVLSSLRHPHIVSLIGVTTDPSNDETMLVLELAENGSLDKLIRNQGALNKSQVIQYALDIAQGISYLHSRNIIHRDLKCANVLLYEESTRAKLADLGAARILATKSKASSVEGTVGFMAPEILHEKPYGPSVDVYSFGAIMYQMITKNTFPLSFKDDNDMENRIRRGVADLEFCQFIISCCYQNPDERPTIQKCIEILQNMQLGKPIVFDHPLVVAEQSSNKIWPLAQPQVINRVSKVRYIRLQDIPVPLETNEEEHIKMVVESAVELTKISTLNNQYAYWFVTAQPVRAYCPYLKYPKQAQFTNQAGVVYYLNLFEASTEDTMISFEFSDNTNESVFIATFVTADQYFDPTSVTVPNPYPPNISVVVSTSRPKNQFTSIPKRNIHYHHSRLSEKPLDVSRLIWMLQGNASYPSIQMEQLQNAVNYLPPITSDEAKNIALLFTEGRDQVLRVLFPKVVDRENFIGVVTAFIDNQSQCNNLIKEFSL